MTKDQTENEVTLNVPSKEEMANKQHVRPNVKKIEDDDPNNTQNGTDKDAVRGENEDKEGDELIHEAKLVPRRESTTFEVNNASYRDELEKKKGESLTARIALFFASVAEPKDIFEAPREAHIPVPNNQIIDTIHADAKKLQKEGKIEKKDRKALESLLKSMNVYYNMRYNITREALLKDYSFFDPLTSDTMIKMHGLKGEALLAKEDIVLDRLNIILEKANFKMLTAHEVDLATSANYKLKSDVQVDEAGYDPKILERFFRRHRTEFVYRADETDFFLVYYRGVGIAQQTDLFVVEKLELILDRIKFRIKEFVIGLIYKDKKKAQDKLDGLAVSTVKHSFEERRAHGVKVLAGFIIFIGIVHEFLNRYEFGFMEIGIMILVDVIVGMSIGIKYFVPTEKEKFAASPRAQLIQKRKEWREANPRPPPAEGEIMNKIERLRLDQLSLVPGDLLLPNTIQEPTFSEMIVIHREKGSKHIKISEYQDIPMADLELIYPLKKLLLNSTDLVFAVVTLIMGISALISGLTTDDDDGGVDDDVLYSVAIGVIGLAARSYMAHVNAIYYYESLMTETLFSAVGATNRSAILSSVFKCQEQEVSEAVLALWMLIKHGRMSDDDVDKCAEAYMQIKFQVNMDFEVDDALDKLVTLELIEKKEDGRYKAKSPTYLLEVMAERWLEVDLGLANGGGGVVGGVSAVAGGVGSAAMSGAKVLNKINPLKNLF